MRIPKTLISEYEGAIDSYGLRDTWIAYVAHIIEVLRPDLSLNGSLNINETIRTSIIDDHRDTILEDADELYEYGLAYADKDSKKKLGQYYTPTDTARFMSEVLLDFLDGVLPFHDVNRVIEPCCGTGRLITSLITEMESRDIDVWDVICNKLLLCDIDETALMIAQAGILVRFAPIDANIDISGTNSTIKCYCGDFLADGAPSVCADDIVIQNPPYGRVDGSKYHYETSRINDWYPMFLERISGATAAVSITPQSFIGAPSYSSLRKVLDERSGGKIWSYDIVPSGMFCGRKHGIFNTNHANSVRAAIVLTSSKNKGKGFVTAPMLRWHADERPMLFDASRSIIPSDMPDGCSEHGELPWAKAPHIVKKLFSRIMSHNDTTTIGSISTVVDSDENGENVIYVPTSLRYYTSASRRRPNRSSMTALSFDDETYMCLAYLTLNSTVAYAWWRMYDGGITVTKALLKTIPVFHGAVDIDAVVQQAKILMSTESEHINVKMNAGKPNESIKFPQSVLDENTALLIPELTEDERRAMTAFHSSSLADQMAAWRVR